MSYEEIKALKNKMTDIAIHEKCYLVDSKNYNYSGFFVCVDNRVGIVDEDDYSVLLLPCYISSREDFNSFLKDIESSYNLGFDNGKEETQKSLRESLGIKQ